MSLNWTVTPFCWLSYENAFKSGLAINRPAKSKDWLPASISILLIDSTKLRTGCAASLSLGSAALASALVQGVQGGIGPMMRNSIHRTCLAFSGKSEGLQFDVWPSPIIKCYIRRIIALDKLKRNIVIPFAKVFSYPGWLGSA